MFMLSGTGWLMISWKNFSPNSILLSHSVCSSGRLRSFHQNSPRSAMWEADELLAVLVFVDQLDTGAKEPIHLVAEPGPVAPAATAERSHVQLPHEFRERGPQDQLAASGSSPLRSQTQASNRRGMLPKGSLLSPPALMTKA